MRSRFVREPFEELLTVMMRQTAEIRVATPEVCALRDPAVHARPAAPMAGFFLLPLSLSGPWAD